MGILRGDIQNAIFATSMMEGVATSRLLIMSTVSRTLANKTNPSPTSLEMILALESSVYEIFPDTETSMFWEQI